MNDARISPGRVNPGGHGGLRPPRPLIDFMSRIPHIVITYTTYSSSIPQHHHIHRYFFWFHLHTLRHIPYISSMDTNKWDVSEDEVAYLWILSRNMADVRYESKASGVCYYNEWSGKWKTHRIDDRDVPMANWRWSWIYASRAPQSYRNWVNQDRPMAHWMKKHI
jgi:hypothetical protein